MTGDASTPAPSHTASEQELIARITRGDKAAFHILATRYARRGLHTARRMLGNRHDAEDVVQEAFLRLWVYAHHWRAGGASPATWFQRIVANLCIDNLRHRDASRLLSLDAASDVPTSIPDPATRRHAVEIAGSLERGLASLTSRQRRAFELTYLRQMSNGQAAKALGVSTEALESLLGRGRRALRQHLRDHR